MVGKKRKFAVADTAQQVVGGFILAGPFVVTEEVWVLASNMTVWHAFATVFMVLGIGYGALYKADDERDPDREADVVGIPVRFISLIGVTYLSVTILAFAFAAPNTFEAAINEEMTAINILKAISVGSIFSVVGAATADSIF